MLRDTLPHALASGAALAVVALCTVWTAAQLGPAGFGRWAAWQAVSALLLPLVALRLDTRIAVLESREALLPLVAAMLTAALLFTVAGAVAALLLAPWWPPVLVVLTCLMAALICVNEALIASHAHQGQHRQVVVGRTLRQIMPAAGGLAAVLWSPDVEAAAWGTVAGLVMCLPVCLGPLRHGLVLSWRGLIVALRQHAKGLGASLSLGVLNAVWLNGLLPMLNLLGLPQVAGQYALVQRLLGAPLGIFGLALNTVLLREGNALHRSARRMLRLSLGLFAIALLVALLVAWGLAGQRLFPVSSKWLLDPALFAAAAFFLASSFAVGGISVVSIRLRDEWFVAAWQLVALLCWALAIGSLASATAFHVMLLMGGAAYWALLLRWCRVSSRVHGENA